MSTSALRRRPAIQIVALLWGAGIAAMAALTGGDAWPLAVGWVVAGAALGLVWLAAAPRARAYGAGALLVALVALTWEGGLFLLPAALAALVLSARA